MIVYHVKWKVPPPSGMIAMTLYNGDRSKTFASREKAEEFLKRITDACNLLGIYADVKIDQGEME